MPSDDINELMCFVAQFRARNCSIKECCSKLSTSNDITRRKQTEASKISGMCVCIPSESAKTTQEEYRKLQESAKNMKQELRNTKANAKAEEKAISRFTRDAEYKERNLKEELDSVNVR